MAIKTIRLSTPTLRATAVDVLNRAYEMIEAENDHYVCFAVRKAGNYLDQFFVADILRDKISQSLGDHAYVTDWLIKARRLNKNKVMDNQREYRLLWIKEMIAQNKD